MGFGGFFRIFTMNDEKNPMMKKRFNTLKAKEIAKEVVNNTSNDYTQHELIRQEARKAIYDYFGWTKGSVKFINNKLNQTLIDTGKLTGLNA